MLKRAFSLLWPALFLAAGTRGQDTLSFFRPSPVMNTARLHAVTYSLGGAYALSMAGLYQLWYKDYDLVAFHFFDDAPEWLQFDKMGHTGSAYYVSKWSGGLFRWAGLPNRRAAWYGGLTGMALMTSIEVFDGFSAGWGFSWSDMAYNTAGAGLMTGQQLAWGEQRVQLKFSHHPTDFAQYRPDQLGTSYPARLFKDYNGSTVWLSCNIGSFLRAGSRFPRWLSVAAGYGVEGLTGARENVLYYDGMAVPAFERYRQYYVSLDVDLTRLRKKPGFLKSLLEVFGFLKIPAPAVEFNRVDKVRFHWMYF